MEFSICKNFTDSLKTEWNLLLDESIDHVPFLRHEYLDAWWKSHGGGEWSQDSELAIVAAHEGNRLVGIAPLFAATWEGKRTLLLVGSIEISDYLDLIVRPADLNAFSVELLRFLADPASGAPDWERLDLYNILDSSPSLAALQAAAQQTGMAYHLEQFRPTLTINLPGDWETYLAGIDKKQRHEIRRKMRRAHAGDLPVSWYIAKDPAKIDGEIEDFLHLMDLDPEKARFLTPPMRENFRRIIRCAFDEGCLLMAFLEVDGNKAASYLSFDYLDQLWVYNSGMDPSYNEYSPGWVMLGELLKWANDNKRRTFDFMRGDEEYKIRFGATTRYVMRATISKTA